MYAAQMQAYKTVQKSTLTGRDIEAAALTSAALKLTECKERWGEEGHFQRLDEALRTNQRIWTIFQTESAREDNPQPELVKKNLLTLSLFIDRRIIEAMAKPAPEKLDILINININIAAGLRGSPA